MLRVTKGQKAILEVIPTLDSPFRPLDVFQSVKHIASRAATDSYLAKLVNDGVLTKPQFGFYAATKTTKKYCSQPMDITQHGNAGHQRKPRKTHAAPVEETPQINISRTADNLAENISSLIKENSDYRNLLLKVHETIGKALGLDQQPTED